MFGALNRFIGRLDSDLPKQPTSTTGDNSYGFQILRNKDPDLPLEPWFDFIVGINGRLIDEPDPHLFATEVRNCAGTSVSLEIWSAKGQRTHNVVIPIPPEKPTLGLTLQLAPLSSTQHIWHILSIPSPLSPAYLAGLLPHSDYILGTPSGTLRGEAALGELVEDHLNRSLTLWVYNSEFDVVREVEIVPNRNWGGEGALGAILGYGALHRLPVGLGEEVDGPGEVVFDTKDGITEQIKQSPKIQPGNHFLVPAEMASLPPLSPSVNSGQVSQAATTHGRHGRKARHVHTVPTSFDEYFRESEQKSKEEDFVPSQAGTPVAPPPKATDRGNVTSPGLEGASTPAE
ncbi:hypothetical protein D8B26_002069 [Coccidioides posadasii str. Silveira]|uniref:Golgi reassembly stacking protein n=3 Tax=Coccidioides posadasii TaxID=199306 RepID=E9CXE4_COCPS|nr:GRASP55/65 family protein [Coccidioides posadasii C735 delta SOWgp]EER23912.1 GRASP55/65 family protein [Coccidioides posadasii C735 delta SOWgp]EFW21970.1 golgi reassembly stacking protein [Coccidioides posadasii str. Silveira]KMM65429.1 golgi reassembly-stacking protein 2 [Coccidioides posadasii RMSCC 3488]QVM07369.1 hypothetical protein D8B26_002069 [Coccidioides posadasii str. Silveira]|eukprot:XP_003066057.1 GRASP55/65 family protein [Coccidioides posadasii C735 delta SOWgp]